MDTGLVFDVGMHEAEDARFYLRKGFRVVAVEANPRLCRRARWRFWAAIARRRLVVVEGAIAEAPGRTDFIVFEGRAQCGALDNHYARRNVAEKKLTPRRICVPAIRLEPLLERYGVPYYLKIDIEGADLVCLHALQHFEDRPAFVSVEIDYMQRDLSEAMLDELVALGYRRFKIVPQDVDWPAFSKARPQREGRPCDHMFERGSSGPFGEDTAGQWEDADEIRAAFAVGLEALDWHDLHAAR